MPMVIPFLFYPLEVIKAIRWSFEVMEVNSVDKGNNLGNWIAQRNKLFEFIHNLINQSLKYGDVLDRTQSWNEAQTINFLPFFVLDEVNLAWRRSVKKKTSGSKKR